MEKSVAISMNGIIADMPTTSIVETAIEKNIKKISDFFNFLSSKFFNFIKNKFNLFSIALVN